MRLPPLERLLPNTPVLTRKTVDAPRRGNFSYALVKTATVPFAFFPRIYFSLSLVSYFKFEVMSGAFQLSCERYGKP